MNYDGAAHTATATATGVDGEDFSADLDLSGTTHTNAGTYTDTWTFTDPTGDYENASGTITDTVGQAQAAITITPYSGTFNGHAYTATGTATGVGGVDLSANLDLSGTTHTNAGTYTDTWTFTDPSGNYQTVSGSVTDAIGQASITVTPYSVTYDGNAHTATGTATGVGGVDLSADLNLSGTTHTSAASYTDTWTFIDPTGDYQEASGTVVDSIGQAAASITITPYSGPYTGVAYTATGKATGVDGEDLSADLALSGATHASAGTYTDTWTFTDPNGYYQSVSGTITDRIGLATTTTKATDAGGTYDGLTAFAAGSAVTGAGTISGVTSLDYFDNTTSVDLGSTAPVNAGNYTVTATYAGDANHTGSNGSATFTVSPASSATRVSDAGGTYDGLTAFAANSAVTGPGVISGVASLDYYDSTTNVDLGADAPVNAGSYTVTATYAGDANHTGGTGSTTFTVNQATASITVTPYRVTYDGAPYTASGSATGASGVDLSGDLALNGTSHTSAGTYTDTWTFTDPTGNYQSANGTISDSIARARVTVTVTSYSVTYDGNAHAASAAVVGVLGESLSGLDVADTTHTNAGTYADTWLFLDNTGNYYDSSGSVTDTIDQAVATINVTPCSLTYDSNSHTATGTATGVWGVDLTADLNLSGTSHTNAGTYTDSWTFTDPAGNYQSASGTVTDIINKANATVVVTPYDVTYDGTAHTASYTVTGVGSDTSAAGSSIALSTTHTNAGTYASDSWSFSGGTNYNNISAQTITDIIKQAVASVTVTPYSVTYNAGAHTAAGAATGVGGLGLSADLSLSGTTRTNAGTYTDSWTFTDAAGNYQSASGTVSDVINKANATVVVTSYNVTFDGNAHTATYTVTGVGTDTAAAGSSIALSTTHTNAGTYASDSWSFSGGTNYNNISAQTITDIIKQAVASVTITPYTNTYNAGAHTAAGTATGVGGVGLGADLNLSGTSHTNAGTYTDSWTFTDPAGNYQRASGTVSDVINKANATVVVTPYNVTYDGTAHTATYTVTGVGSDTSAAGSSIALSTTHTNAGTYASDSWSFSGGTNYNDIGAQTITDIIKQAVASVTVTPYSVTYNAGAHTAAGAATGVGGLGLSADLSLSGTTHTNAGTYGGDSWTFTDPAGNYQSASGSVTDIINKANATVVVTPYNVTYDGNGHTATYTVTGVGTDTSAAGSTIALSTTHTNAGTYASDSWSFSGGTNYNNISVQTITDTINKAALTITADKETKTYGTTLTFAGTEFMTSGLHGSDSVTSVSLASSGAAAAAAVGTYPITVNNAVGTGLANYTIAYANGTLTVAAPNWTTYGTIYVLDPTAGGALNLSGSASVSVTGDVMVDSSSSSAITVSGAASVKAAGMQVVGGVQKSGSPTLSPQPVTGSQVVADPLAALPLPVIPSSPTNYGSKSIGGSTTTTLQPGLYSQISISGAANVTLAAGTYVIQGGGFTASGSAVVSIGAGTSIILEGGGLSVSGAAAVSGTAVTVFNLGTGFNGTTDGGSFGPITLSGSGSVSLTPPSSGTYAGIIIFQGRDNAKALTFSGAAMQGITGMIYAPAAQLAESGSAQVGSTKNPISMVVDTLTLSGAAVANSVGLSSYAGTVAYTPAQIRGAYGINSLAQDGTGQTIAIVDAYDDPSIAQAVDDFDSQFNPRDSGPSLYDLYGPASSFLTVLNQDGSSTSLPSLDPTGTGASNWELEEELDVEWAHAVAPGAQIILVEANSQSLSDLMDAAATAAAQSGVSVVSMSWGFPEGQAVFAADEATYDHVFEVPGVTFVASTGDYGAADPEYPAFSPNVVAVGGTSLLLNADNSYNSETGWGYYSGSAGTFIGSGGGISLYEPEPAYQQSIQSTGGRTTPDVALVADPATGAWIADPYNLDPSDPFQVVGGTSLSAPAWAGLLALIDQGRASAGQSALNSASSTETQQALYSLPRDEFNVIAGGNNGYSASAGYNLVTGLGTPVANRLVPDLVAYAGPGTTYAGPKVGPLQNATLVNTAADGSGGLDEFSVLDALTMGGGDSVIPGSAATNFIGESSAIGQHHHRVPEGSGSAATTEPSPVQPIAPLHVTSPPPAADVSSAGMTSLDDVLAAHDAALTEWSSTGPRSRQRIKIPTNNAGITALPVRSRLAPRRARPVVLQETMADSALEKLGALPSRPRSWSIRADRAAD